MRITERRRNSGRNHIAKTLCNLEAGPGAIAQLVERLNGIQEVRGSTPLGSTFVAKRVNPQSLLYPQGHPPGFIRPAQTILPHLPLKRDDPPEPLSAPSGRNDTRRNRKFGHRGNGEYHPQ